MVKWLPIPVLLFVATACAPTVPPLSLLGKWHTVKAGDTTERVADQYGVDAETLAELNQIPESGEIKGREQIFIPLASGKPPGDGKPQKTAPRPAPPKTTASARSASVAPAPVAVASRPKSRCGKDGRPCFMWPLKGEVIRWFGDAGGGTESASDGIDIRAARGTAVVATDDGEVLYSGDAIKGYGNLLLLRHENNVISVYAHNERNLAREGDKVKRGEKIAEVGDSGAAAETLLHFEVRVGEQPLDPMLYLESKE
ncbi:MAG: peptidoglycan DD-metalloendopeptidase family protein [Deltaproteobacteria bacterium]|nr:peptidoglycan DD-metalloendopeptidase family protein [Deltaproteobacteria bacterium]